MCNKEGERDKATDESAVIAIYIKALEVEKLRGLMNVILNGAAVLKDWKNSLVKLLHKGGKGEELKNYRPIAIIRVKYKLCMLNVREMIYEWAVDSGLLVEVQGESREGRRTKDNLFMLERLIEMVKGRNEELLVASVYNYGESI